MGGIGFLAYRVFHSDPVRCWFESAPLGHGCEDFLECFLRVSQNRKRAWYCVCMIFLVHTQIYYILMCFTTYKKFQGNNRYWILRSLTFSSTSSLGFSHRWFQTRYKAVVGDLVVCTYCEWRSLEPALIACRGMWQNLRCFGAMVQCKWKQVLSFGWYCWWKKNCTT